MLKIISLCLALVACATGSAQEITRYEADIQDFTELRVTSPINVNYVANPDSAGKAVFYATPAMASEISFANSKNKLTVEFTSKGAKIPGTPTVTVYSRFLNMVENRSDSLIRIVKVSPGPELKLRVIGNGRISALDVEFNEVSASITTGKGTIAVGGSCSVANLTSHSTGTIQADRLKAGIVRCKLVGTGEIGCWPVDELKVSMSVGSGTILYRGEPKKIKKYAGGIKLKQLPDE